MEFLNSFERPVSPKTRSNNSDNIFVYSFVFILCSLCSSSFFYLITMERFICTSIEHGDHATKRRAPDSNSNNIVRYPINILYKIHLRIRKSAGMSPFYANERPSWFAARQLSKPYNAAKVFPIHLELATRVSAQASERASECSALTAIIEPLSFRNARDNRPRSRGWITA